MACLADVHLTDLACRLFRREFNCAQIRIALGKVPFNVPEVALLEDLKPFAITNREQRHIEFRSLLLARLSTPVRNYGDVSFMRRPEGAWCRSSPSGP